MRSRNFLLAGFTSLLATFVASACATSGGDAGGDSTTDQGDSGTATGGEASTGDDSGGGGGNGQDSGGGSTCAPGPCTTNPGAPCITGNIECVSDGTQKCVDATFASAGVACGAGKSCDGEGSCVAGNGEGGASCTPGGACSTNGGAPCKTGVIACSGGVSSCVDNGNASQGTSCGGANVCDGNGSCVAPDGGSSCTPGGACSSNPGAPCKTGAVVCNGGVASCGDNGNAAAGTSCGSGKVCDGSGTCVGAPDGGGTCHIVVNEVQTAGTGGASDEWVEIFNPCGSAVDVSSYKLVYRSAAGSTDVALASMSGSIAAGGYKLYTGSAYTGSGSDGTMAGGLAGTAGGVAVRDGSGNIVDSMGYGAATNAFVETAPTVAPASAQSVGRSPNGHDTNNNTVDFKLYTTPTPKAANP